MAAPFQISIGMNTREVAAGAARAADAIEDITDSLDDLARASRKGGDEFERAGDDLEKGMREGRREADKAGDAMRDLARQTRKAGDEADDAGRRGAGGVRKLGDTGREVSGELRQNLGETFSSFRGELEDLPQIAQDTLGGLAGSGALGGIVGLAATAAGAAGLGLIVGAIQQQVEEAERLRERLGSAYQSAAEDGRTYLDTAQLIAETNDLIFNTERADEWKQVQKDAVAIGLDRSTVINANAGDLSALAEVEDAIAARRSKYAEAESEQMGRGNAGISEQARLTNELENRWRAKGEVAQEAEANAQIAMEETSARLRQSINDAGEATKAVDQFGNELYTLPDGKQIMIDAETGQATADVSRFRGDADGMIDHLNGREIVTRMRLDDSDLRYYQPPTIYIPGRIVPRGGNQLF